MLKTSRLAVRDDVIRMRLRPNNLILYRLRKITYFLTTIHNICEVLGNR